MSEKSVVDRYDISNCGDRNCDPLVLNADGAYVEYAEYERLADEYDKAWRHDLNDKNNVQVLTAEVVRLNAEIEAFKVANGELSEISTARRNHLSNAKKAAGIGPMDDLVGAIEALRKDAERYRWLRGRIPGSAYRIAGVIYSEGGDGVDAGIDAAMTK